MQKTIAECRPLDHSNYKVATNHWGLEYVGDLEKCQKCGRPTFEAWFKALDWQSRDRAYWKQVFRDAAEQKVFFFRAQPPYGSHGNVWVDAEVNDPASVLRPTFPQWVKGGIEVEIKQTRYRNRLVQTKRHHYGLFQPGIDRAIRNMTRKLDCVDNINFAAVDSRRDMRRYRDAMDRGCCGRADQEISVLGRKFMIGCRYGH